jgi:hypothetical protein
MRIGTRPRTPSTMRTTSGASPRGGMKSITRTTPSVVSNSVSSTRVSSRYRRRVAVISPAGAMVQWPFSSVPSSAAKIAPESNRGTHSQSMAPLRPTRAAVWVSAMIA